MKNPRQAEVIREDESCKYVLDEMGETHCFVKGSMNRTNAPVGEKGLVRYCTGASYGLWFFEQKTETRILKDTVEREDGT